MLFPGRERAEGHKEWPAAGLLAGWLPDGISPKASDLDLMWLERSYFW